MHRLFRVRAFLITMLIAPVMMAAAPAMASPSPASMISPAIRTVPMRFLAQSHLLAGTRPLFGAIDVSGLFTAGNIAVAVGILLTAIFSFVKLRADRKRLIASIAHHAYLTVEDLDAQGALHIPKVEAGLKAADEWAVKNGWRPLDPGEQQVAQLQFTALNGAAKQAEKVAANAVLKAAAPSAASPVAAAVAKVPPAPAA